MTRPGVPPLPLFIVWLDAAVAVARADDQNTDLVVEAKVLAAAFAECDVEVHLRLELLLLPEPML